MTYEEYANFILSLSPEQRQTLLIALRARAISIDDGDFFRDHLGAFHPTAIGV